MTLNKKSGVSGAAVHRALGRPSALAAALFGLALLAGVPLSLLDGCAPEPAGAPLPSMTVVIDDAGLAEPSLVQRLCRIAAPFSVAVLPGEAHSVECAEIAHRAGKEVMVHLPLEPLSKPPGLYLGREPITFDMAEDAVRLRVRQHLAAVPHRVGVNNHMGSRITPDRQRMTWILQEIKAKGLFFVDSRTIKDTVACSVARELGIPAAQRTVYLDNERSVPAIRTQWQQCVAAAQKDGWALAIGHVHDETITVMEELVPASKGVVRFITAGELTTHQRH